MDFGVSGDDIGEWELTDTLSDDDIESLLNIIRSEIKKPGRSTTVRFYKPVEEITKPTDKARRYKYAGTWILTIMTQPIEDTKKSANETTE